jgi:hypothetical protein
MCEMERPRSMDVIHMSDNALYANPGQGQAFSLGRDRCISMMIGREKGTAPGQPAAEPRVDILDQRPTGKPV